MRRSLLVTLLAATAMLPATAFAQENDRAERRIENREGGQPDQAPRQREFRQPPGDNGGQFRQRAERPQQVQQQPQVVLAPAPSPAPAPAFRRDPGQDRGQFQNRGQFQDRGQFQNRGQFQDRGQVGSGQNNGGFGRDRGQDRPAFNPALQNGRGQAELNPNFRQQPPANFRNDRLDYRRDPRQDGRPDARPDFRQNGRPDFRQDGRQDYRRDDRRGGYDGNRGNYNRDRGYNDGNRGNWNRGWHQNNQYNWQGYRNYNRGLFQLPRYYAPYGWNYGYRRFSIGYTLNSILFNQSYWIDDPEYYRLPPAYGPYRWVRYYNDALLVDIYSGEVVDTVYDIFW